MLRSLTTSMRLKRTATIACAAAALAAWLAAAATTGVRPAPVPREKPAPPAQSDLDFVAEVARLHERLTPSATVVRPGRDLFRFGSERPKRAPAAAPHAAAIVESPVAAPAVVARPAIKLEGIATDGAGDALVRTAILSTQNQLFLAREGDPVSSRYKVVRISADVVELLDVVDNTTLRLPLK